MMFLSHLNVTIKFNTRCQSPSTVLELTEYVNESPAAYEKDLNLTQEKLNEETHTPDVGAEIL